MATQAQVKWKFEADYLQGCNCDYGCPCEFEAPPTMGFCDGLSVWRIDRGTYGDVAMDGLGLGIGLHSPEALHHGNLTIAVFIDEKADERQRAALTAIATGKDGGLPYEIVAAMTTKWLGPIVVPFDFNIDGKNSSVKLGDALSLALEPVKNPVTGQEEGVRVVHETGFVFKEAEVVSAKVNEIKVDGLTFSYPDKSGFVTRVSYGN